MLSRFLVDVITFILATWQRLSIHVFVCMRIAGQQHKYEDEEEVEVDGEHRENKRRTQTVEVTAKDVTIFKCCHYIVLI